MNLTKLENLVMLFFSVYINIEIITYLKFIFSLPFNQYRKLISYIL